ncbi:rho GTPase-activating protein 27-like [Limulus polyphemus]|uniref:Rho GTPase-activating protein 27-like n=1 Tax=Limulus polyphemus TaxID=6850 RepID=A0ABM1BHF7_LIMPO|nr:rho GTPase-activating protein 27-like [Limulus polyphemus]
MSIDPDVTVQALYDFSYVTDDGRQISLKKGEEYLLLKKANKDWWQVMRDGEKKAFYAPASYVVIVSGLGTNHEEEPLDKTDTNANIVLEDNFRSNFNSDQDHKLLPKNKVVTNGNNNTTISAKITNVQKRAALSFNNPLCADDDFEEPEADYTDEDRETEESLDDDGNKSTDSASGEVIRKMDESENSKNTTPTSAVQTQNIQQPSSPIYANLPIVSRMTPPFPSPSDSPLRILLDDWVEYADETGRKFYFNKLTHEKSWKPPRRKNNKQDCPSNSKSNSPLADTSPDVTRPFLQYEIKQDIHGTSKENVSYKNVICLSPPKSPKSKSQRWKLKLNPGYGSSTDSLDSPESPSTLSSKEDWTRFPLSNIPKGWRQEVDKVTKEVYFVNNSTTKKWFSSIDDNGRRYFFAEDSSESFWDLPSVSLADVKCVKDTKDEVSPLKSKQKNISPPNSLSSNFVPKKVNFSTSGLSRADRGLRTRSLVLPETVTSSSLDDSDKICNVPRSDREIMNLQWPLFQDGKLSVIKQGTLNRTKLIEGSRRQKKNWSSCCVILTDLFLLIYKDIRPTNMTVMDTKPEMCVDLKGTLVEWCPDKSSRKNVFQISTVLGQRVLLQDDNAQTSMEWFNSIKTAVMGLPSGFDHQLTHTDQQDHNVKGLKDEKKRNKVARSKSTKPIRGSGDDSLETSPLEKKKKIRDRLRNFFLRRPTMESLKEKGIIKDEPVFGCNLHSLCSREKVEVPKFVKKCVQAIENRDLSADGIYRVSGNLAQVQKIRFHVNQDDYSLLEEEEDIHVLTGALKMFFREMKEPLVPFKALPQFLSAMEQNTKQEKLKHFKKLVRSLPRPNYSTLKFLFSHLLKTTKASEQNRMHVQNLAIVFGPTLMWSEKESSNIALDFMQQNLVIEFLLLEFDEVFG